MMVDLSLIVGFDWDRGNARKNDKLDVSMFEVEQIFFNAPLLLLDDIKHNQQELRYHALGKTHLHRLLHLTFTLRENNTLICVISARDMHRKERWFYEHEKH